MDVFQIRLADNPSASVRCEDCVIGECRNGICFERGAATPSRALTLGVSVGFQVFLAGKFSSHLRNSLLCFSRRSWLACGDRASIHWVNACLGVDARIKEGCVDFSFVFRFVNPRPTSREANSLIEVASLASPFEALTESIYELILNSFFRRT